MNTLNEYLNPIETQTDLYAKALSNFILATRFLGKNSNLLRGLEGHVLRRYQQQYQNDLIAEKLPMRKLNEGSVPMEVITQVVQSRQYPVHLPGFAGDSVAAREWSLDFFQERYGSMVLPVTTGAQYDDMTIGEVVEMIKTGDRDRQKYLQAVSNIFVHHNELYNDLPMRKIFQLQRSGFHGAEFFMGGPGTGSPWHCANEWTFFIMAAGRKKWRFIKPEFTLHMKPMFQKDLIYLVSGYGAEDPENVTAYDVTLEQGDMLVFPAWWWHRVENMTDVTIGVSVRFRTLMQQIKSPNPILSLLQLTTAQQWKNILIERLTGKHRCDERYLRRALNMVPQK